MKILRMTASFGRLQNAQLELGEGVNLLQGPNEVGKSTWSAFLRAMFYGISTKERDRQGFLAEKNRYQPWSGAAMEGTMDLIWQGQEITLRRGSKASVAFGKFEAVYTDTGEPVPLLTGENAGEALLGVPREVFERSAFVGQGVAYVDGAPALEKRIAALVSSGEEDVSYSQVDRRLRDWQNRRRHNKTGVIPRLESELTVLEATLAKQSHARRLAEDAQQEIDMLEREQCALEREITVHRSVVEEKRRKNYQQAADALTAVEEEVDTLRMELTKNGRPPDWETLRRAQEDLNYLNTLAANLKLAEGQLGLTQEAANAARAAAQDPLFPDMMPEAAWQKAKEDAAEVNAAPKGQVLRWALAGGCLAVSAVGFAFSRMNLLFAALGGVFALLAILWGVLAVARKKRFERSRGESLARYGAICSDDMLARAVDLREKWVVAVEAEKQLAAVELSRTQIADQRETLKTELLDLVHTFAPMVKDTFGISAAISRTLALEEKLATSTIRMEGARRLVQSVPQPESEPSCAVQDVMPRFPYQETAARLAAIKGEITRLGSTLAMAQGELNSLGDQVHFQSQRDALLDELERRRTEYDALGLALSALEQANGELQSRFSPALNLKAGEILSALTGGKYDRLALTRDFEATAGEAGGILPRRAITLSQGTADQLYLAVRLAVCVLALPAEDLAPLVLDDVLASFDDARMALALDYLYTLGGRRQIIFFTCHGRETAYLAGRAGVKTATLQSQS